MRAKKDLETSVDTLLHAPRDRVEAARINKANTHNWKYRINREFDCPILLQTSGETVVLFSSNCARN